MSRSRHTTHRRGRWRCSCCARYPFYLSNDGRRLERVEAREREDENDVGLIAYDLWSADEASSCDCDECRAGVTWNA